MKHLLISLALMLSLVGNAKEVGPSIEEFNTQYLGTQWAYPLSNGNSKVITFTDEYEFTIGYVDYNKKPISSTIRGYIFPSDQVYGCYPIFSVNYVPIKKYEQFGNYNSLRFISARFRDGALVVTCAYVTKKGELIDMHVEKYYNITQY